MLVSGLQAQMWQMSFMVAPAALPEVDHNLRVDERVLRWLLSKKRHTAPMPNTFKIKKTVFRNLGKQGFYPIPFDDEEISFALDGEADNQEVRFTATNQACIL